MNLQILSSAFDHRCTPAEQIRKEQHWFSVILRCKIVSGACAFNMAGLVSVGANREVWPDCMLTALPCTEPLLQFGMVKLPRIVHSGVTAVSGAYRFWLGGNTVEESREAPRTGLM
eukprot:991601-Rhodomonas_salina.1